MGKLKKCLICCNWINWSYVKSRMKKYSSCNWPELTTYCGCCSVPTGIYIRSVVTAIISIVTVIPNGIFLTDTLEAQKIVFSGNVSELIADWIIDDFPDKSTILAIYKALIAYHATWIMFRVTYAFFSAWVIYAVYLKHARKLKIILYINVSLWLIEFVLSFINLFFIDYNVTIIMIISHVSELYNILAIRSYYIKLRGKSRLVSEASIASPYLIGNALTSGQHCRTCTCTVQRNSIRNDIILTSENETSPNDSTSIDRVVIDETPVVEACGSRHSNLPPYKGPLSDEAVIYDKAQLNVGSNPVLEDRYSAV